jgi:hypothetical protein
MEEKEGTDKGEKPALCRLGYGCRRLIVILVRVRRLGGELLDGEFKSSALLLGWRQVTQQSSPSTTSDSILCCRKRSQQPPRCNLLRSCGRIPVFAPRTVSIAPVSSQEIHFSDAEGQLLELPPLSPRAVVIDSTHSTLLHASLQAPLHAPSLPSLTSQGVVL